MTNQDAKGTQFSTKYFTIKDLRSQIDICMNSVKYLKNSAEVTLSLRSMERAFSWLGEALKASGSTSPYVSSQDPSTDTIEPPADRTEESFQAKWADLEFPQTHTARVKDFRAIIGSILPHYDIIIDSIIDWNKTKAVSHCLEKSKDDLVEARMWLGWELARIKKIKEANSIPVFVDQQELPL